MNIQKRISFLIWAKNCMKRAITRGDRRYLRMARSHFRSAFGR